MPIVSTSGSAVKLQPAPLSLTSCPTHPKLEEIDN